MVDLLYRALLWISIAYLMCYLSEEIGSNTGKFLGNALKIKPDINWGNFVAMAGLLVAPFAMVLREAEYAFQRHNIRIAAVSTIVFLLAKISSDLVLICYGMMSFVLGWSIYLFTNNNPTSHEYLIFGISLPFYLVIMFFLSFMSLIVRSELNGRLFGWWRSQFPAFGRVAIYSLSLVVFGVVSWVHH
ncbi:hypothetical protein ACJJIC_19005 [Microbulbifer sp. ANSA002]|uniref:hypothetical protein n=1 Tax=unclassified Microbulbifer TaxID=2619833 RepID=UPI0040438D3D